MDPLFVALMYLRRRDYDAAAATCTAMLERQPRDQAAWVTKTIALTEKVYIDDTDVEEAGLAEEMMKDDTRSGASHGGLSFARPETSAVRPMTGMSRPTSGYVRPATQSRLGTSSGATSRPLTSRPIQSSAGRYVRLNTAAFAAEPGGPFIPVASLDLKRYAKKPTIARALFGYILYVENSPVKALELASLAHERAGARDWWWKTQIGKCYYQLGLYRDAERFYNSSIKEQDMAETHLHLAKIFFRTDQPTRALAVYRLGLESHPSEVALMLGIARVYDALGDSAKAMEEYERVLKLDPSNAEAIASLGAHAFYSDQPEIALRYFRRLLQTGVHTVQVWNNIGLCCFWAQQFDLALGCCERALELASDDNESADVWYNLSHVAIALGDVLLAVRALKVCIACNGQHAQALNNLGAIQALQGSLAEARAELHAAVDAEPRLAEPHVNSALLAYRQGEFAPAFAHARQALAVAPGNAVASELVEKLRELIGH